MIRLRAKAASSGKEKPWEPEGKFRKLFTLLSKSQKPWPLRDRGSLEGPDNVAFQDGGIEDCQTTTAGPQLVWLSGLSAGL